MTKVGWMDSDDFQKHSNGANHPECPERLYSIREHIGKSHALGRLDLKQAPLITESELEHIHTAEHIQHVKKLAASGGGFFDNDTSCIPESWDAARRAAGAVAQSVKNVIDGTWNRAFCSARPPGHHAPSHRAMGFCLFNNVAIGAATALEHDEIKKVAILDWDVHHGNGTQDIFYERDDVIFASIHQYPFYPGSGSNTETGQGKGLGSSVNCPLALGSGSAEYILSWQDTILPAFESFAPDILLISAGFDADKRDPIGGLNVTPAGFETLSEEVLEWADQHCQGRVVSTLEGGYNIDALGEDVRIHLETMLG